MSCEIIKKYYEAFNKKEFSQMLAAVDSSVVHEINEGAAEVGTDKFKIFLDVMDEHYDEKVVNLEIFSGQTRGRFAAEFFIEGRYLKSQDGLPEANEQSYRLRVGAFFEVSEDKITRISNFYNLSDWISQVTSE